MRHPREGISSGLQNKEVCNGLFAFSLKFFFESKKSKKKLVVRPKSALRPKSASVAFCELFRGCSSVQHDDKIVPKL